MTDDPKTLVSTDWLAKHLNDPDMRVIDGSWYLPAAARDPKAEFDACHIPGARFFDIDEIADLRSDLPHMAPPPEKFMSRMRALGVGDGHQVVVYDGMGLMSAARVWWTFKLMGHKDVAVLDGGFPKWQTEGRDVEDMPPIIKDRHMSTRYQNDLVRDVTHVSQASKLGLSQILDARPNDRFRGEGVEPREGLRSGHIPGSKNVPFGSLLNTDGTMIDPPALRNVFEKAGLDLTKPIITTCGSGVTAAILALGLTRIGHDQWSLYDGSWTEWGQFDTLPIATGEA
ncbi:MAG: 3-mercaptopyruvate sulfurtransferase [Paracoccaceae bacterium]